MTEPLDLLSRDFAVDEPPPRRPFLWFGVTFTVLLLSPVILVLSLRWIAPPFSAFMLQSQVQPVRYTWVPASRMPESLRKAVVASEDQKFWTHNGFDLEAIEKAMEHNKNSRKVRGASTISQQVAKNLFLWSSRSYVRKGLEVCITVLIEALWPKDRILETYLNIAEFGPGLYGVQAAAQKYFSKDAAQLTPGEAATLVAVLPSPRVWRVINPGRYVQSRVDWILVQIGERPRYTRPPVEEPALPIEPETGPAEEPEEPSATPPAPAGSDTEPAPAPEQAQPDAPEPAPEPQPAPAPAQDPARDQSL